MEVSVSALRSELRRWIDTARKGEEVIVTEHAVPVARLSAVDSTPTLERLVDEGVIGPPARATRPRASGRRRVRAKGSVSDYVSRHRG